MRGAPAIALLALTLGAREAWAEVPTGVDVDLGVTLPLEGWRETTGLGLGGGLRARVPVGGELEATARLGATGHFATTFTRVGVPATRRLLQLPLTFGVRYPINAPARLRVVLGAELGLAWNRQWVAAAGAREVDAELVAVGALAVGVVVGRLTVQASLWFADLAARDEHLGVVLGLAGTLRRPR